MKDSITTKKIKYRTRTVVAYVGHCWWPGCKYNTYPIFNERGCEETINNHVRRHKGKK